ncbi:MAG: response regulator, partial [Lachnospiraceae bacterium]|nr:response regulator [Lachnospiraceae bacterium]
MNKRVLIVDDEEMITELLSDHLGDEGYEIYTANSTSRALELLPKMPNLIILDMSLINISEPT